MLGKGNHWALSELNYTVIYSRMLKLELSKLHHFTYWGSFTLCSINFGDLFLFLFWSIYKQTIFIIVHNKGHKDQ